MSRWFIALIFISFLLPSITTNTHAQSPLIEMHEEVVDFGASIRFIVDFNSSLDISSADLFIISSGQANNSETFPVTINDHHLDISYSISRNNTYDPFSELHYYFRLGLSDGQQVNTETISFIYEDTRLAWQELSQNENVTVFWSEGDLAFGQEVVNGANNGLSRIYQLLGIPLFKPVRIYVYPNSGALQSALDLSGESNVSGHADPHSGVALVSIAPGAEQNIQIERQVPHELMHILLYQALGERYTRIPTWLNEGLASAAELYPNPDYSRILDSAAEQNDLLNFNDLCVSFPPDASRAFQAYAQSDSFLRFLHSTYGADAMIDLIDSYANGVACDSGTVSATGRTLFQLKADWQKNALLMNRASSAAQGLSPWLGLLLIILIIPGALIIISSIKK